LGRIHVLDDHVINRIAAGEVVERPASVVKELIENALDAGARSIRVRVEAGGRRLIEVADDGCGMSGEDARLALERHATSKLEHEGDLEAIATLGFRGEALPSIAAVSRFHLESADEEGRGTEIDVLGGAIESPRSIARARGTTVRIEQLFYNVPARRKFLKTEATELAHIVRCVTRYALAHAQRRFELHSGTRSLLNVQPSELLSERIAQIYTPSMAEGLLPFERSWPGLRVHGLAGRPVDARPRRDAQYFFVNGRTVQDRTIGHAVHQAYDNTMPHGRHPSLFLFIEMDPTRVDVNVHPQKTEVRFSESRTIHEGVRNAVSSALTAENAVPRLEQLGVREATLSYLERHRPAAAQPAPFAAPSPSPATTGDLIEVMEPPGRNRQAVPLAQINESYIVAQDRQGLVLIDQHAAHERVLFERYMAQAEDDQVEVQQLLFPLTIDLTVDEHILLQAELDEFRRLGFRLEDFGGHTVRLDGVPHYAADVDPESLLRELIGEARQVRTTAIANTELRRRLITSAACQAAIKVNYPLETPAMQRLLDDLFVTVNPSTCPHGRPALFRLTLDEIERAFKRK